jgi:cysteine dioxygenase
MDSRKLTSVATLSDLIAELHEVFSEDHVNVEYVDAVMRSYKSNPAEWKMYAKFDPFKYTRNLVDAGNGKFNLMVLAWGEGHGSAIHDHSNSHCFMKMLHGELVESRFPWPSEEEANTDIGTQLIPIGETRIGLNEVCYINDDLGLHRVENRSHTDTAVSLHLYCPPFDACQMFDQRTGRRTTCPVTFWSKYGDKVNNVKSVLKKN